MIMLLLASIDGVDFRSDVDGVHDVISRSSAAIWWVNTKRLPGAYAAAPASSWSIAHSYLLKQLPVFYCSGA